jgi:hypothetical protein
MAISFPKNHRFIFYSCWIILGLFQSALTELQDDEAYYWVYGQYLDWGYFDHPPMIGLLVKAGYSLFPNELGVRLLPMVMNVMTLLLLEKLTAKKNPFLFYAIALSIAVLQLTGFYAVPDTPLIFFTALFFLCYRRFSNDVSILNSIWLGISIALLFYSKYHAVLVVLFVLLSNLKLLRKYQAYVAALVALLLFLPHLFWQYQHNWVSFRYHLFESNVNAYRISFTGDYLLGQLLLPGPMAGFILLPAALLYRPGDATEKAMKFTLIGIYIFFLLSSFRGKVEANWTSPALIPLFVLSHQFLLFKAGWNKWLIKILPFTLILVLAARIIMIADILPVKEVRKRFHSWKDWPAEMRQRTGGLPVVFSNSYQRASKYWFYSGQQTYSQNWYRERSNNFNFWPVEDSLLGKQVYFMDIFLLSRFTDSLKTPLGWIGYSHDPSFVSFAKAKYVPINEMIEEKQGEGFILKGALQLPTHYKDFLLSHEIADDSTRVGIFSNKGWVKDIFTPLRINKLARDPNFELPVNSRLPKGNYFLRFSINVGSYNPTHNSDKIKLTVK